ncbi:hypothetical protein [Streptomyces paludis]|uniref:Translation initiation factor 2 n=1 Tax=Streptomyces paludis TaxID=2282738 RepID=A0A345HX76_9ACTN|nr:hypothetical protein [Streptomyces paludis]AXG81300.1 hypothetical protein DVK44_30425 [Streptomyces paludis]
MGEGRAGWLRVPVGADAERWTTRGRCRLVLFVVHNVTSATRLLDVLPLFRDDLRVQSLITCTGSSPFQAGVAELMAETGVPVLPWEQALALPAHLAISASFGGRLPLLDAPLTVLSHGVGYNKRLATPDTGHRTPDTGRPSPVFGLSPEWLLADGSPVADAMVLSHPEQLDRLRAACPEAAPTAVIAGDPCFDRILAALPHRERFRRALDVRPGQRLVLLNSTWNPDALFGDGGADDVLPSLLPRLTAELPADEYRVAAVLHPNIWHGHGPGQIRAWLDRARRGGLALVDPLEGWRQALIAADAVIGDAGSVSYYAAALGVPVLMGAEPSDGLDAASPVAAFVRRAPRLSPYAPLRAQLDALLNGPVSAPGSRPGPGPGSGPASGPGPAELVSSVPGEAATLLRRHFYRLIGIPEPDEPALLDPLPLPPYERTVRTAPLRVVTRLPPNGGIEVSRYADPRSEPAGEGDAHTAVHEDTLDPGRLALADVIFRDGAADDVRFGGPERWTAEILTRHPHCSVAAFITGPGTCLARVGGTNSAGTLLRLDGGAWAADPALHVSALHAHLAAGGKVEELTAAGLTVRTGRHTHRVTVTIADPAPVTPRAR